MLCSVEGKCHQCCAQHKEVVDQACFQGWSLVPSRAFSPSGERKAWCPSLRPGWHLHTEALLCVWATNQLDQQVTTTILSIYSRTECKLLILYEVLGPFKCITIYITNQKKNPNVTKSYLLKFYKKWQSMKSCVVHREDIRVDSSTVEGQDLHSGDHCCCVQHETESEQGFLTI